MTHKIKMPKGSSRGYCLTRNNYTSADIELMKKLVYQYLIIGKEVGEKGTPHLQCYVYFKNQRSFASMKKKLPGFHIEAANGSADQNRIYCSKDGNFEELGSIPKQGERKDLNEVKENIVNGMTVDEIVMEDPMLYHQYGRTLEKIEDICLRKKFRTEMTRGVWIYGPTDVGKSHCLFSGFSPDTHFVKCLDDDWWDGYKGQPYVLLNEFRGQLLYSKLLELCDKWPTTVKRRNREPAPFLAKEIWVSSCMHPLQVYSGVVDREEDINQLLRRFEVRHVLNRNDSEVVRGNTNPDPDEDFIEL